MGAPDDPIGTLRRTVARHASRSVAALIVDTTLAYCGGAFPDDPEDVAELLRAHLHTTARLLLGVKRADDLVIEAQAMLAERLPAARKRTGLTTRNFTSSAFEAVLVVSNDGELTGALRRSVSRRVRVAAIPTHGVMDDALEETRESSRFIVSEPPSVCPALERALLAGALTGRTLLLLRGAGAIELDATVARAPRATVLRCAAEATHLDIAMLLPLGAPRADA